MARSLLARPAAVAALALGLLIGLPALRLLTETPGVMLFAVVPIVAFGMMFGVRGGLIAALVSSAGFLGLALLSGPDPGTVNDLGTPVAFFVLGTVTGIYAHGALGNFDLRAIARRAELRAAIRRGEIVFHYQPLTDARTGAVVALEALARWEHPQRGLLPPAEFIPLAEGQERTIWELTRYALERALADTAELASVGPVPTVAVNVSAASLYRRDLAGELAAALHRHQRAPDSVILEITEYAIATDRARAASSLAELRAMGTSVAIDDFGSGYSSLSRLALMPLELLKLDLSVFSGRVLERREELVRGVVALAHALGLTVVAERVEDSEWLELVTRSGCDVVQGFRIGRPMPVAETAEWLEGHQSSASVYREPGHERQLLTSDD